MVFGLLDPMQDPWRIAGGPQKMVRREQLVHEQVQEEMVGGEVGRKH